MLISVSVIYCYMRKLNKYLRFYVILLLAAAQHENRHSTFESYKSSMHKGLIFSFIGDMFLVWENECFLFGLSAFAIGHIFYVNAFKSSSTQLGFAVFGYTSGGCIYKLYLHGRNYCNNK